MDVLCWKKEGDILVQINHPEYLVMIMLTLLSIILVTAYVAIKKWGPEKLEDKKR